MCHTETSGLGGVAHVKQRNSGGWWNKKIPPIGRILPDQDASSHQATPGTLATLAA